MLNLIFHRIMLFLQTLPLNFLEHFYQKIKFHKSVQILNKISINIGYEKELLKKI